ncbi:lipid droplet-associated hydrolase [Phlebotomus argentipes]|uniref:lipid droplet-associated hydrolase n=1 Tax=Phlebotomus argentipes TaxID=94469 RepID=UPI00289376FC|nr:lipid droplet-associated hydrolase [Phlebotomus argentipes]
MSDESISELCENISSNVHSLGFDDNPNHTAKEAIVIVPGNPGITGFYDTFAEEIYFKLDKKIPVLVTGHLGHQASHVDPPLQGNEHLYDLDGQVKNQIKNILSTVPKDTNLYFIGHSIGCWMILEMLKLANIKQRTRKCFMLFPTIERMSESPNGKYFCSATIRLYPILKFFVTLIYWLPEFVKGFLIRSFAKWKSYDKTMLSPINHYINPVAIEKSFTLALEEMRRVKELDIQALQDNKDLIKMFYGATDGWVPVKYYEEVCENVPGIDAELDNKGIAHAFVLKSGKEMASIVANWIRDIM